MSHFTTVQTQLKDVGTLKKALSSLGWGFVEADVNTKLAVQGWEGAVLEADIAVQSGCKYGIGVNIQEDGTCILEADWWAIETFTERTRETILQELTQRYAYCTVMDKIHDLGYQVVEEKEQADRHLRIVVRKWQ